MTKYFIMKPILYYDYEVVGQAILDLNLSEPDDDEAAEEDILLQSYKSGKDIQVSSKVEKENVIDSKASILKPQEKPKSQPSIQENQFPSKSELIQAKERPTFVQEKPTFVREKPKFVQDKPTQAVSEQDGFRISFQKTASDPMTRSLNMDTKKRASEQQNPNYEREIRELQQKIEQLTKNLAENKNSSIQSIQHAYDVEKLELLQQISALQQRIAQLSETIPVLNTIYNGGASPNKGQHREYEDETDEFYKLSAELEEGYREVIAAEQQYILHKKFNLPSEIL